MTVYVFFGLIASGKSTLAQAWADRLRIACYNSDVIRKELAGRAGPGRDLQFNQGIYAEQFTRETYQALMDRAAAELGRSRSVVLDASYRARADRESLRALAEKHGVAIRFILCSCPESELKLRLETRARDPKAVSDGRWEIYQKQKELFEEPEELATEELMVFSTQAPVNLLVEQLAAGLRERL